MPPSKSINKDRNNGNEASKVVQSEGGRSSGKRMTILFPPDLNDNLQWIAEQQGISQAEAVRKSVALESYLRQALLRPGARILIEDDNSIKEVIIR